MFCPKCGQQNPETGKFCRSCGTDLGNVSQALSGTLPAEVPSGRRKRKPAGCEAAYTQIFMGAAFVIVAIILGATGKGSGWWFWMLIPAFIMLGNGFAKFAQAKSEQREHVAFAAESNAAIGVAPVASLTPVQTEFVSPTESRYKTGDLVPPSVTDSTTRHLEIDSEGKTMTLPKK